jgi:UDPglucose 6-dehydrogenase
MVPGRLTMIYLLVLLRTLRVWLLLRYYTGGPTGWSIGMHLVVVGTGYVGLVSGACLADFGHDVTCVDSDPNRIDALMAGHVPFFEPGLTELVKTNMNANRLRFATGLVEPMREAQAAFIAVGTPSRAGDGVADLSFVYQAVREVASTLTGFTVVITKSTVPVGVGDEVDRIIREVAPNAEFAVVSNPEFLREGAAIRDFKLPDRIVIGTDDRRAREVMEEIYRPLYLNSSPILWTGRRNAELIKYAANAFLATKVAFINEMAELCEAVGGDVQEVARGIGMDNRIGSKFLHAGPGYGGSCFPKDTSALIKTGQDYAAPLRIIEAVVSSNEQRPRVMARKISKALAGQVRGKNVGILGLTFKPNTDDMRDSPSIPLIRAIQDMGALVRAYDPAGMEQAKRFLSNVTFCEDAYTCAQAADALVIITEWEQFRALDLDRLEGLMSQPVIVDLRNIYRVDDMKKRGFRYVSVGRLAVNGERSPNTTRPSSSKARTAVLAVERT